MTRAVRLFPLLLPFALAACEFADVDTGETGDGAPDLVGVYTSEVTDISGCEGVLDPVPFTGSLAITGTPEALTFAWAELTATGSVDEAFAIALSGSGDVPAGGLLLEADGLATRDAGGAWLLDLGFSAEVSPNDTADTAATCTATGTLEATQESAR